MKELKQEVLDVLEVLPTLSLDVEPIEQFDDLTIEREDGQNSKYLLTLERLVPSVEGVARKQD